MLDFAWSEFALIGIVALLFIGPKDMPVAIRTVTGLLKKGRKLASEFQSHVDEMVRDADLGEAQDQLKQLRSFNIRGQLMRALDEDGSIKRTFEQKPVMAVGLGQVPAGMPRVLAAHEPATASSQPYATQPFAMQEVAMPSWHSPAAPPDEEDPELAAADPAPAILPPGTASRLRAERARLPPPRFVPPRPSHPAAIRPARPPFPDHAAPVAGAMPGGTDASRAARTVPPGRETVR